MTNEPVGAAELTVGAVVLLMSAVLALNVLARRVHVPSPIALVLGGLALALVPGVGAIRFDPDLVFFVFLPPVLWAAAYHTSQRDFRADLRPISFLAVGAVLVTAVGVAVVTHALFPDVGWAGAVTLGAIVAPPDAAAATAVFGGLEVPRRVRAVLEGESLVNDATALTLYRVAVAAAVTGTFALAPSLGQFVVAGVGGVAVGAAVGAACRWAMLSAVASGDRLSGITLSFVAPYAAYVAAERLGTSAVLACVAGGFVLRRGAARSAPATRLQGAGVWDVVVSVLNAVIFVLIGLVLRDVVRALPRPALARAAVAGAVVSVAVVVLRIAWVYSTAWYADRPEQRRRATPMPAPEPLRAARPLVAWAGLRGIVSIASALSLPLHTAAGAPFPRRGEFVVVTFVVVLATLVGQGATLGPLTRRLRLPRDDSRREKHAARAYAAAAALAYLESVEGTSGVNSAHVARLRTHYAARRGRLAAVRRTPPVRGANFRRLRSATLAAERAAVRTLREQGAIGDDVLEHIEHELDVDAMRAGVGELVHPEVQG